MINATVRTSGEDEGPESDDARWGTLVDELRAGAEEQMRSNIRAAQMTSTKQAYEDATRFEPIDNGIRISVGTKGAFSLAGAQERGQKPWHEAGPFLAGGGDPRAQRPQRGATVFRTISQGGKKRVIPIDSGYPQKGGGDWDHPGLPKLGLLQLTKKEIVKNLLPRLYARYNGGGAE